MRTTTTTITPANMGADSDKTNISLAGCGYLGIYHVGVASCIRKFAPHILTKNKISGASVGALVAAAFACNVPLEACTNSVFDVSMRVRCGILGPITPDLNIMKMLYDNMSAILPEDAHLRCNGRLFISVTRYSDCQNVLLSQFDSKEDLLQALMCSCFIPLYCGYNPPEFHGVAYVDGGYSDNSPHLDCHTVTVAPFSGTSGICPRDKSGDFRNFNMNNTSIYITMKNCRRLFRILFPGPPDMLKELCQKGFNDGLLFLRDRGIVQCPDCDPKLILSVENGYLKHENCKPMQYPLPIEICDEINRAVQRLNQSLGYRLFQNPVLKMLYYVNIPSIFTVKMSCALLSVVTRKLQHKASSCVDNVLNDLPQLLSEILMQAKQKSKFPCHIDFDVSVDDLEQDEQNCLNEGHVSASSQTNTDSSSVLIIDNSKDSLYSEEKLLRAMMNTNATAKEYSRTEVFRIPPKSSANVTDVNTKEYVIRHCNLSEKTQNILNEEEENRRSVPNGNIVF